VLERLQQTAALAREQEWPYERFLEPLLEAEVFARDASGVRTRVRHAGFPALKTLEDFDWSAQPTAERPLVLHLAQLAWIEEHASVCFLGPPGTGETHLATALGLKACERGYRVAFRDRAGRVSRLEAAQDRSQLEHELRRLERYHLLVVDEVGYLPLERQAANLLFALVSRRYERGSIIVTSNRGFEQLGRDPRRRHGRRPLTPDRSGSGLRACRLGPESFCDMRQVLADGLLGCVRVACCYCLDDCAVLGV
jgi:DNA replication protein DnaC